MLEWGELRHFLAVARGGSTLSASKILGVNQTTVARRVAALEEALGEKLFEKTAGGYRLTEVGSAMVQNAERVETEADAFARMVAQRSRKLLGMIRVTTNDVLADCLLTPWLREFTQRFPVVQVETIITDRRLDISRGEADIALRANTSKGPPLGEGVGLEIGPDLVGDPALLHHLHLEPSREPAVQDPAKEEERREEEGELRHAVLPPLEWTNWTI